MGDNLILYNNQERQSENDVKRRPRALTPMNSFLLTLMRLRRNFSILHLSFLFCISSTTYSNIFISYITLHTVYKSWHKKYLSDNVTSQKNNAQLNDKKKYPNTKCIISVVLPEIKVEVPFWVSILHSGASGYSILIITESYYCKGPCRNNTWWRI